MVVFIIFILKHWAVNFSCLWKNLLITNKLHITGGTKKWSPSTNQWPRVTPYSILVNLASNNGLVPDGTKPLPEAILICHQYISFTQDILLKISWYLLLSVQCVWNFSFKITATSAIPHFIRITTRRFTSPLFTPVYLWGCYVVSLHVHVLVAVHRDAAAELQPDPWSARAASTPYCREGTLTSLSSTSI